MNPQAIYNDLRAKAAAPLIAYLDDLQAKVDCLKALQAQSHAELDALLPSILDKAFKGEMQAMSLNKAAQNPAMTSSQGNQSRH
jgi:hypothetical protein